MLSCQRFSGEPSHRVFLFPTSCRIIATSQMQATHARKAFPCFDEPDMKAVFNVTIVHDRSTKALSNGRDIGQKDLVLEGRPVRVTTFEPTERMSSYLLAFIVTDFTSIQSDKYDFSVRNASYRSLWRTFNWLINTN